MTNLLRQAFRYVYYTIYGGPGKKITINNEEYTVSAYVARGIRNTIDETPLKLLTNFSRNAGLVFDIGGNIGLISVLLSKQMKPGSVIYSFEPAPLSFKYLQDCARVQKGNAKIIPVNYAVSNNNNKLRFTNDGNSCTNHISDANDTNAIEVDSITIDSFCKAENKVPDVMKIDIEGAEYWALDGMRGTLKNNNCLVLVEMHNDFLQEHGISNDMFASLISDIGYKVYNTAGNEISRDTVMNNVCVILSKNQPDKKLFQIN